MFLAVEREDEHRRQGGKWHRIAPLLAAKFNINEGDFWRALKGEVRKLQEELAGLDLEKMLATDPANDGETGTG